MREEPVNIDANVIAAYLERQARPNMAAFIRVLDSRSRDAYRREEALKDKIAALAARLHKHEPPPNRQPDVVWTGD
jgi:phage host-nuclease inhibitor protein Gam